MSSPWGKVVEVAPVDLQEIMSEEFARGLQDKENHKFGLLLDKEHALQQQSQPIEEIVSNCEGIPEHVLSALKEEVPYKLDDFCDSDTLIAQMLQVQFDREHDTELKRIEKQTNKDSKVSVSLSKYRMLPDELMYDSEDDEPYDPKPKHWDRFETNNRLYESLPKKGFGYDEDGIMITKHDENICGVRNACRVMSFPPEFPTGDAAAFDMKLPNSVFNQLRSYSQRVGAKKTTKAHDRRENAATAEMGIDERTRLILYKLINNQVLEQINGIISTGKEAVILHAKSDPAYEGELVLPKECAVKVFMTTLNEFKQRDRYIKDDYRFKDRFSKQNNRVIINMWAEKEMHNLMRIQRSGIPCPEVIVLKKHVLVMSFIGDDSVAAPKLKDAHLSDAELSVAYEEMQDIMYKLYNNAKLVHADLSEYNVLWHEDKCWLIDVAQSVEPGHPSALEFMMRDCHNICSFFERRGVPNVKTKEELFSHITGLDSCAHNAAMLERIHVKGPSMVVATAPNSDEIPEALKPMAYPFDYAWEKSKELKAEVGGPSGVVH